MVSFLQGFIMGGGVGVGCHASHRIVGESTQIAMPECGIGLMPDVGGSLPAGARAGAIWANTSALTGARMGPGDAILAGFADRLPARAELGGAEGRADRRPATPARSTAPGHARQRRSPRSRRRSTRFSPATTLADILRALRHDGQRLRQRHAEGCSRRNSPLSMACDAGDGAPARGGASLRAALAQEYRFTWRAMEQGDFLEGIRAAIIDKDRSPALAPRRRRDVPAAEVAAMLTPLGAEA